MIVSYVLESCRRLQSTSYPMTHIVHWNDQMIKLDVWGLAVQKTDSLASTEVKSEGSRNLGKYIKYSYKKLNYSKRKMKHNPYWNTKNNSRTDQKHF
jgi:nitrous oxidase accessory protein NosD